MRTVKDLIEELQKFDPDLVVVKSTQEFNDGVVLSTKFEIKEGVETFKDFRDEVSREQKVLYIK